MEWIQNAKHSGDSGKLEKPRWWGRWRNIANFNRPADIIPPHERDFYIDNIKRLIIKYGKPIVKTYIEIEIKKNISKTWDLYNIDPNNLVTIIPNLPCTWQNIEFVEQTIRKVNTVLYFQHILSDEFAHKYYRLREALNIWLAGCTQPIDTLDLNENDPFDVSENDFDTPLNNNDENGAKPDKVKNKIDKERPKKPNCKKLKCEEEDPGTEGTPVFYPEEWKWYCLYKSKICIDIDIRLPDIPIPPIPIVPIPIIPIRIPNYEGNTLPPPTTKQTTTKPTTTNKTKPKYTMKIPGLKTHGITTEDTIITTPTTSKVSTTQKITYRSLPAIPKDLPGPPEIEQNILLQDCWGYYWPYSLRFDTDGRKFLRKEGINPDKIDWINFKWTECGDKELPNFELTDAQKFKIRMVHKQFAAFDIMTEEYKDKEYLQWWPATKSEVYNEYIVFNKKQSIRTRWYRLFPSQYTWEIHETYYFWPGMYRESIKKLNVIPPDDYPLRELYVIGKC